MIMTVFQAKDGLRFICLATPMHLHDRAGKLASLLYKDEKPSVCLSDRPADISAVSALIDVTLARHESCIFWNHVVHLYKSSSATIRPHECAKGTGVSYTAINR